MLAMGPMMIVQDASTAVMLRLFDGHLQPNVPKWGYQMDNDPTAMAQKIDAAAGNGIDHFLFDWYWYNETDGLFQDGALEQGFLQAKNNNIDTP